MLRTGLGCGGEGVISLILVSYLCRVEGAGEANWGRSKGFVAGAGAGAGGARGGFVPLAEGESLTRGM